MLWSSIFLMRKGLHLDPAPDGSDAEHTREANRHPNLEAAAVPPNSISKTRTFFSRQYKREISEEEARRIQASMRAFFDLLVEWRDMGTEPTQPAIGTEKPDDATGVE